MCKNFTLLLCLLAAFAGAALAGDDPCKGEKGPGKSLCTAYCEATDCDCGYDPDCVMPLASETGCFNIYFSYGFTTGNPLTCGDVCPCLDANGWPSLRKESATALCRRLGREKTPDCTRAGALGPAYPPESMARPGAAAADPWNFAERRDGRVARW